MRHNRTKLIPSPSWVTQFISLGLLMMVVMSCTLPAERKFSQQDAAIVMVGFLAYEAIIAAQDYSVYAGAGDLITSIDDAAAYLESAKFNESLAQELIDMLSQEMPEDNLDTRIEAWREVNSRLSNEAQRISPENGLNLKNFGTSLGYVSWVLASLLDVHEEQKTKGEGIGDDMRQLMGSTLGERLFLSGEKIPLPEKMAKTFTTAKMRDLNNLEGCKNFSSDLKRLEKMLRTVALNGEAGLEKF